MDKKFCPNCGAQLRPGAKFCPKCGFDLTKTSAAKPASQPAPEQAEPEEESQPEPVPDQPVQPHKPMSKRQKAWLIVVAVIVVLLGGFYAWGSNYYSQASQVSRIVSAMKNPKADLSKYVTADDPDLKVTAASLKPLQHYYADRPTQADSLGTSFANAESNDDSITLQQSGRYWLFFPKYKLFVKTYAPKLVTNHAHAAVTMNGKSVGSLTGSGKHFAKKMQPLFPGTYKVKVKSTVAGRKLQASALVNLWSNQTVKLNIRTANFTVDSVPGATVYINDHRAGKLNGSGQLEFKNYPITDNIKLYVLAKLSGQEVQSKTVSDLSAALPGGDNEPIDTSDVHHRGRRYVVIPKWKGLIGKNDAQNLIESAFKDVSEDAFTNGSHNSDYQQIKQMEDNWNNDYDINGYDIDVSGISIMPAANSESSIVFRVTYTFHQDDSDHKQVMEYHGGLIQKSGNDYKFKTVGKGKVVSDKHIDNDSDNDDDDDDDD